MLDSFGCSPIWERRSIDEQPPPAMLTIVSKVPVRAMRLILDVYMNFYSTFGDTCECLPAATATGAAGSADPTVEDASVAGGSRGMAIVIATAWRPITTPHTVSSDRGWG